MELTKEELLFVINVLAEISVPVKNTEAIKVISTAQGVINKMSKMVNEVEETIAEEKEQV